MSVMGLGFEYMPCKNFIQRATFPTQMFLFINCKQHNYVWRLRYLYYSESNWRKGFKEYWFQALRF